YPSGNYIYVEGYKKGQTTYKITVDSSLKDTFGQSLGTSVTATIKVGSTGQTLSSQGGFMSVLDPTAKPAFSIYTTNHASVNVKMYVVQPQDWTAYQEYIRHLNYDDGKQLAIPGRLVFDKAVAIQNKPDEMVETRLDIGRALDGGFGNVIVDVQPTVKKDKYDRGRVITWLQATQIGLDAFVDSAELVGYASDLNTGRPIAGVDLAIYPNGENLSGSRLSETGDTPAAGTLARVWSWLTGWGSNQANKIASFDEDGSALDIETIEAAQTNRTGDNGILRLSLPSTSSEKSQNILVAKRGKDVAFLPESTDYYWQERGSWYKKDQPDSLRWFVFDDRKMYKPKEEVSVKGYIRKITGGKLGDVAGLGDAASGISYSIKDPRNNEIGSGKANLNAFGAFDLKFTLPDNANLGYARIELSTGSSLNGNTYNHQFQIQEFRRPEFEVSTRVESEAPFFVGGSAQVSVEGKYYSGGGLANADANWTVTASPTNYTPPNRGDFTFGTWVPWWGVSGRGDMSYGGYGSTTQTFKGLTDASGKHLLKIDFESVKPARPYTVSAAASIQDVNRQTWSSSTSLLVHPSSLYVGIKTPRTFVQKGEKIEVESIVSTIDGDLVAGRDVEIKAVLRDWLFDKGTWKEETIDEQNCSVKSAEAAQKCEFIAKQGGRYTITATVMDDRERFNESEFTVWVPGGKTPPKRSVEQEEVQIIPSKKDFAPGDIAELLVISPFTPAEGVLTLRRDGIVKTERFSMKDSSITLKIPLEEKYLPNIYAQVDLIGAATRTNDKGEVVEKLSKRPAFASGNINLAISTEARRLTVSAEPRDKTLAPGGSTKIDLVVKDNNGEPVANSEVAVVVVDESVLALSRYRVDDPIGLFYSMRGTGTQDYHSRKDVLLGNPDDVKAPPPPPMADATDTIAKSKMSAREIEGLPRSTGFTSALKSLPGTRPEPMGGQFSIDGATGSENGFVVDGQETNGAVDEAGKPIQQRINFDALAVFAPSVKTDSSGKATVDIKLPDNLTRYRITAVAVDPGKRFGSTESSITAKQPLMVRPSAPRFMNFGDKIDLPVVVQNQTDQDMAVDVAIRATNAFLTGGTSITPSAEAAATAPQIGAEFSAVGKRVVVKANSREEVRFPVSTMKAGTARFQIAVTSGKFSDAADISLPVWTPATTEAFATYGTTDENGAIIQPVQTPGDVFPQFGGLEVTTSSTQLQELTDAFIYLTNYPYACSEQISSRMISIAAMRDVLDAFKAKDMPTKAQLDSYFARDIEILRSRQRDDGSFGLWKRDRDRYEFPFLTVHVAHALALAKAKGYKVPDEMINKTKPYLKNVEKFYNDEWYKNSPQVRWTISAYALYIRDLMGDKDTAKAKKLLAEATIEKMPFEALGWILSVLADDAGSTVEVDTIKRFLMNRTTETAATANFVTDYGDGAWLIMYSNRRADGVLLEALIKAETAPGGNASVNERAAKSSNAPLPADRVSARDLIPKLVRGLLDHRVKGAWSNTQENVFILLALDKYFNAFEKVTPDFVTRIWLGGTYAGEETFKGRSVDSNVLNIPMSYLVDQGGTSNLLIDREGSGRLYYRIGVKYAPKDLKLAPADYGFTVLRQYEAVDNAEDVKQNADGSWTIKAGARIFVRLSMVAPARRYHVALVDQLPAGLEILNPELAVTESIPADKRGGEPVIEFGTRSFGRGNWYWRQYWFEHQNFRDERAEAFASLLWEGVYNYTY
ncbi:MAG TPA: alpha-2-macroglobulin family protein, partial [Pyrinomonadaceae bacterium]|nr:alpha-2-macroglobulin family protein [Pyrinomonadaceae bacterium]